MGGQDSWTWTRPGTWYRYQGTNKNTGTTFIQKFYQQLGIQSLVDNFYQKQGHLISALDASVDQF